jgi:hypothetical protein
MPLYRQIAMRPGAYETAVGRQIYLSPADLARCRENTLKLLARGWRVPVFLGHVEYATGLGGPRLTAPSTSQRWLGRASSSTAVGRLVDVTLEPDGSLAHVILVGRRHLAQLRQRRMRFTSPEIRSSFQAAPGETIGPIIAHVALTRWPLCRGQTRLARVRPEAEAEQPTSDSPFFSKGNPMHEEPELTTPLADEALPEPQPEVAAPPIVADRVTLAERIRRSRRLPKGLRERLCEFVETLQFSADAMGEPVVPVAEAVSMIEAAVPEHWQLDDDELEEPPHPHGEDFFRGHGAGISDEEAERIAAEQLAASGFGPSS